MTFDVVFGVFAAAMVAIAVLAARWAIGVGRQARGLDDEPREGGRSES